MGVMWTCMTDLDRGIEPSPGPVEMLKGTQRHNYASNVGGYMWEQ